MNECSSSLIQGTFPPCNSKYFAPTLRDVLLRSQTNIWVHIQGLRTFEVYSSSRCSCFFTIPKKISYFKLLFLWMTWPRGIFFHSQTLDKSQGCELTLESLQSHKLLVLISKKNYEWKIVRSLKKQEQGSLIYITS